MKHLVVGYKGSIGSRHYRLLQEAGEEVCGVDKGDDIKDDYDMIWICTPGSEKLKYMSQFHGKKIFIEKPFGHDVDSNVWVACNYRFHPAVIKLKEALPKVGKVLYCRMHFSHYLPYQRKNWKEYMKDTNIILDAGWHFVDLALWMFGKIGRGKGKVTADFEFDFKDFAEVMIPHENGIVTFINLDYLRRDKSWGIEVVGTEGTLTLLAENKNPEFVTVHGYRNGNYGYYMKETAIDPDEMYRNQLNYLLKENWTSNIGEAIEVMKIVSD